MHLLSRLIYGSLFFFFLLACEQSDNLRSGELVAPVCTGFSFRDANNVPMGRIGEPNNKLTSTNGLITMYAFPIPASNQINIITNSSSNKKIWITQAQATAEVMSSLNYLNASFQVVGGSPLIGFNNVPATEVMINVSFLPKGIYRLYIQVDQELLWENLIIQ